MTCQNFGPSQPRYLKLPSTEWKPSYSVIMFVIKSDLSSDPETEGYGAGRDTSGLSPAVGLG